MHDEWSISATRREALLKEYGEVAGNFRLLTDIRFKLLALLPIAAGAATALLSAGAGRDGAAEARTLVLSLFGLLVTVALVTYNDRNDQLYDTLVARAASIERQLGLFDGAFANRPTSWFAVTLPFVRQPARWTRPLKWKNAEWRVNHRNPVTLIYGAASALWLFSAFAATAELVWGNDAAPRGVLVAGILPAILVPAVTVHGVREQRKQRARRMRADAIAATDALRDRTLADLAADDDFLTICARLGRVSIDDARARAHFYSRHANDVRRSFMPQEPEVLAAAHFVALISDMPAEWIEDCATERRKLLRGDGAGRSGSAMSPDADADQA